MAIHTYDKLVRDKIPEIIEASGKTYHAYVMEDEEYARRLGEKLGEEAAEFLASRDVEELADILEVVYALAAHKGYTREQLEAIRLEKAQQRGGFDKRLCLTMVNDWK